MTLSEAWATLGVAPGTTLAEARDRYRLLLRANHPDLRPGEPAAAARAAAVTEAWAVLQRAPVLPVPPTPPPRPRPGALVVDGDTLALGVPADEAFLLLLEAAHEVGDVTYVDLDGGLLEVVVDCGTHCSLLVTLQGRSDGTTEAMCCLEPLGRAPAPPVAVVVDALVAALCP